MEKPIYLKYTHKAVEYRDPANRPWNQECSNCVHFINAKPPRCEGVKSPISPTAWCTRYSRKKN